MIDRSKVKIVYSVACAGATVWIAGILAAPLLTARAARWAPFFYACFSPVCHQIPERSFVLFGFPLAVCARCFGIYVGFAVGLAVYPALRGFERFRLPSIQTLLLFSTPIGIDAAANILGLWTTPNLIRFAAGLAWGPILPFYFVTGAAELALDLRKWVQKNRIKPDSQRRPG